MQRFVKISDFKVSHHKTKQSPVRFCCVVWVDLREKKTHAVEC